jgi:uncharacterized protein (TIGR02246 family)
MIIPALTIALAIPAAAQQLTDQQARQVAQGLDDNFDKAFKAKDAAAIAALHTEDAVHVGGYGDTDLGRAAIEKYYVKGVQNFDGDPLKIDQIKIINNDTIVVFGFWSGIFHGENGPVHMAGRWVNTDVRVGDTWKVAAVMSSVTPQK